MKTTVENKVYTLEEYIRHEQQQDGKRHELINGQLYEMPFEKKINNRIARRLANLIEHQLSPDYQIFTNDVAVAVPGYDSYYCPDVVGSRENDSERPFNDYMCYEPEIIVEVVSESNYRHDYVDKLIDYRKIPSLKYYLIVEPENVFITLHERISNANWQTITYTSADEHMELSQLNISIQLLDIYK